MDITDFQNLIKNLYYKKDGARGIEKTFMWLIEEVGELSSILKEKRPNIEKASEEIADIMAWTISIANLLEIDVEKALLDKYPNKCRKCNKNPCECAK
ncbi:MAG: nucleotide pyrophosphohydrolase [Promethearchaeota archaeon]|nr:MAG: nucleotide pyrophosphohydrolase [Candidatus Lokiarchaeota archaeon]